MAGTLDREAAGDNSGGKGRRQVNPAVGRAGAMRAPVQRRQSELRAAPEGTVTLRISSKPHDDTES